MDIIKLYTRISLLAYFILNISQLIAQNDTIVVDDSSRLGEDTTVHVADLVETNSLVTEKETDDGKTIVYHFTLNDGIMPPAWRLIQRATDEAKAANADYIVFRLNTYGGMVDMADSIRTRLLNIEIPTVVFINNNAASAGALISIACDSIYMIKGANIGAATVVNQTGEQMPDKYQSYMRSTMRSTAEAQGRDPKIAEAMVDDRISIPGVIDSGYTLTFTTTEAIENGFCEGQVESIKEIIEERLGLDNYEIVEYKEDLMDKVIAFLLNPAVSGVLMLMIMGGIWFELQTPGVGFPLIAAIIGAVLYFAPLYLEGLAENWEILLFVVGIILLAVEIFVLPGFGVAGISGMLIIIASLTLALLQNVVFDFSFVDIDQVALALARVVIVFIVGIGVMAFFGRNLLDSGFFQKMVVQEVQDASKGYTVAEEKTTSLIGKTGVAVTDLRPSGKVEVNDQRYDGSAEGEFIDKETVVKVVRVMGHFVYVLKGDKQA